MDSSRPLYLVVSAFNATYTLERFFTSLYRQSDSNWRLYIVDDCSTDNSYDSILRYSDKIIEFFLIEILVILD